MKKTLLLGCSFLFACLLNALFWTHALDQTEQQEILVLPLDGRPVNTHFMQELADIQNASLIFPDKDYYTLKGDAKLSYLTSFSAKHHQIDGFIVSLDGLFFNGLLQSRVLSEVKDFHEENIINEYLMFLQTLKKEHPSAPMLAYKSIPRLTTNVMSEIELDTYTHYSHLTKNLDRYFFKNQLSVGRPPMENKNITTSFDDYMTTRSIHLRLSQQLIRFQQQHHLFDELIFSQDDSSPVGIHKLEQYLLKKETQNAPNSSISFTSGIDELGHVLVHKLLNKEPLRVFVAYTSEEARTSYIAFDEKDVASLVQEKTNLYNFTLTPKEQDADIILFIHYPKMSSEEEFKRIRSNFIDKYTHYSALNKQIAIVDLSFSNKDRQLAPTLIENSLLNEKTTYVSWNTASNSLGLALSQAFTYHQSTYAKKDEEQVDLVSYRLLKDYYYKSIHSANLKKQLVSLSIDTYGDARVHSFAHGLEADLTKNLHTIQQSYPTNMEQKKVTHVYFPFNRLFEVDFSLTHE